MNHPLAGLTAFLVALLGSLILTPLVARAAVRLGIVDRPDGYRKIQRGVTPLGGGIAVVIATVVGVMAVILVGSLIESASSSAKDFQFLMAAVPATLVILAVGLVDDVWTLTGIYKLIGQVLAVSLLLAAGLEFQSISVLGWEIDLGNLGVPFTMCFCLAAINAFNLIDGLDGLASSVGALVLGTLGVLAATQGQAAASATCLAMAGALAGFLNYNFAPARIYLGDTGSMLIGLIVAVVAIHSSIKEQTAFALAVPIAVCAIPFLDVTAALIRRVTTGQSVFTPDRGHLHHALLQRGWQVRGTVAFIAVLTAITCGGALAGFYTRLDYLAVGTTGLVFVGLAVTRVFGHVELALVATKIRAVARRINATESRRQRPSRSNAESAIHMQGKRQWRSIWQALRESGEAHNLTQITLNISIPHLHESYYANWENSDAAAKEPSWRLRIPLQLGGQDAGRVTLAGNGAGIAALTDVQRVIDFLQPIDDQIERLAATLNDSLEEETLSEADSSTLLEKPAKFSGDLAPAVNAIAR